MRYKRTILAHSFGNERERDYFYGLGIASDLMSSTFEIGGNVLNPSFYSSTTSTSTSGDSSARGGLSIRCIKN